MRSPHFPRVAFASPPGAVVLRALGVLPVLDLLPADCLLFAGFRCHAVAVVPALRLPCRPLRLFTLPAPRFSRRRCCSLCVPLLGYAIDVLLAV